MLRLIFHQSPRLSHSGTQIFLHTILTARSGCRAESFIVKPSICEFLRKVYWNTKSIFCLYIFFFFIFFFALSDIPGLRSRRKRKRARERERSSSSMRRVARRSATRGKRDEGGKMGENAGLGRTLWGWWTRFDLTWLWACEGEPVYTYGVRSARLLDA